MKMRMWVFDGARINFDRIMAFLTLSFLAAFCIVGYGVCEINFFYSFQWMFLKLCRFIVNMLEMTKWAFDGVRINFDRIMAG